MSISLPSARARRGLCLAALSAIALTAGAAPAGATTEPQCPVPSPAQAASATPGAPTAVHALGNDASATVTWCAPVQGQAHVVSYTVKASNGQTLTAPVPNDYVIFTGLSNGAAYTFTVTANTASASGPAAGSNSVTPAPIPAPREVLRGRPERVSFDQYSLLIGGRRTVIYSGEFDPWRLPSPSLWLDRLEKMKADGLNAVTPYFDWDYHSPAPGVYDFAGVRDINLFLNDAQRAGLYVIARPGPYINAETDAGGFPGWVVTQQGKARTDAPDYVAAAEQWLSEVDPIIAAHQITRGGDVILYQVENELEYAEPATINYMAELEAKVRADGIDVPLTGNHNAVFQGTPGAVDIPGYDSYPLGFDCSNPSGFGTPPGFTHNPGVPLMIPEFQGGSYDSWGGSGYDNCYALTGPAFENVFYKSNFAQGVTIDSNYMTVGGTNWGWLPAPFMYTSYDYGSMIRESGEIGTPAHPGTVTGSKFGENKLIADFVASVKALAMTVAEAAPTLTNHDIVATARANPSDKTQFIYLRQANASSNATVHTHMALSVTPSFGYTYDDTAPQLTYTGSWSHVSNQSYTTGDYDQTESFSNTTGDSVSVTFTGTAVQWIAPTASNHGIADVYLDGKQVATVDGYSPSTNFQQVLYAASGLSNTTHTLKIVVSGQKNPASGGTYVSIDAINLPSPAAQADYYPSVPQQPGTSITLVGRDARMLLANYAFDGQQLQYSTSELMTHGVSGNQARAVLYGPAGTDGETVLRYPSRPVVSVLSGQVQSTWDAARHDLRLDYVHGGLAEVLISGGGRPALRLLVADTDLAEDLWPLATDRGLAVAQGAYLVRSARLTGATLALTGDTSAPGPLTVWAPPGVSGLSWNGRALAVSRRSDGALTGGLPGPAAVHLPALGNWRFRFESPEAQPDYNDSRWVLADHPTTTNPTPPVTTPVLYADDYGFHHGFIWYRGHFTATGTETGISLAANGGQHGAFEVWLNGAYLGANTSGNQQTQTFAFPPGTLRAGAGNVIAVLVQSSSHDEDGVYGYPPTDSQKNPRGLLGATLNGSAATVTWRLQGNTGGEQLQDPVRGPLNATGLYGTNHGWDLPGFPDGDWQHVSLPDPWTDRGLPEGIGWYRTTFRLDIPRQDFVPVAIHIDGPPHAASAESRAYLFLNGWLIGQYDNQLGPQHDFYVPAGLLDEQGTNTLAIADWALAPGSGGIGDVRLVALGNQLGGVPVTPVASPGYNPAVYGPPSPGAPTLGLATARTLAQPGQPFTVNAVLTDTSVKPLTDAALTLHAPSGWTVSRASTNLGTVPPGVSRRVSFTVTPPTSGLTPGAVALAAVATYNGGHTQQAGVTVQVPYASLGQSFNNSGITDDANPNPGPGFEGFDGAGTTYSAQGLAAAGLSPGAGVSADGLSFTWPNVPPAQPDNTMAEGQIVDVSGHGSKLGFLTATNNSPLSGAGVIYYTDGTTQSYSLNVGNFWYAAGTNGNPPNTQVASVNYANYPTGSSGHTIYVFETSVPINPAKTVEAVMLPPLSSVSGYQPALHVFALAVG
jgi:beta-galactosidase GanA